MQFICQIPYDSALFPGTINAVAYLFMTHGDGDNTWLPDGGENAVIIVPQDKLTGSVTVGDTPRLHKMVKPFWGSRLNTKSVEFSAKLSFSEDPAFVAEEKLSALPDQEADAYQKALTGNKLGGTPGFLQGDELPFADSWHLLLQLDATTVPFWINFGDAGVGYAFINRQGTEGKFLWQCL